MARVQTLSDAEKFLSTYVERARSTVGRDITTEQSIRLAKACDNPQDSLRVVHVAGTSGKTSTSYFIADLLTRAGCKVGLTVSPHVDSVTERIQINGFPLPNDVFCRYLSEFSVIVEDVDFTPSWFEFMMVFAYWVFERENVDYAVIETGLGGLHDGSNIASRSDKVCVLTDIGIDHVEVLGNTLSDIAAQKVGIVWPGNTVVMYSQSTEIMDVVHDKICNTADAELLIVDSINYDAISPTPLYQQRNWHLARSAYEFLQNRDGLGIVQADELEQSEHVQVPGRMDIVQYKNKTIVFDGAHNAQKMTMLVQSFQQLFHRQKAAVLIAQKSKKDIGAIVPLLRTISDTVVATNFNTSQDVPITSILPQRIVALFKLNGFESARADSDPLHAFETLLVGEHKVILVTGSFYLIAEIRAHMLKSPPLDI